MILIRGNLKLKVKLKVEGKISRQKIREKERGNKIPVTMQKCSKK